MSQREVFQYVSNRIHNVCAYVCISVYVIQYHKWWIFIELSRLEKTFKIIESNHQPNLLCLTA